MNRRRSCIQCDAILSSNQLTDVCRDCKGDGPAIRTNQTALIDLMTFSKFGPVAELFVMDAIRTKAKMVAALDPKELAGMGDWSMVSPEAWVGAAKEIDGKLEAFYSRHG